MVLLFPADLVASRSQGRRLRPSGTSARAVAAANALLESLDAGQRARVVLPFSSPKKAGWSNLPVTMVPRNGIRLGDLNKKQRTAALAQHGKSTREPQAT